GAAIAALTSVEALAWRGGARPATPRETGHRSQSNAAFSSSSQGAAVPSLGARQSPRGDRAPAAETLAELGLALRLNWASRKKRSRNTSSHRRIAGRSYSRLSESG